MSNQDKTQPWVLVTGCSSGIGLCIVKTLAEQNYRVIATVRQEKDIKVLTDLNLNISVLLLDLASSYSVQQTLKSVLKTTQGKLYALVNNGAYGQVGALEDISRNALEAQFASNVFGWHELTVGLLPAMKQQNSARVIYISSILGFVAMPFRGAYNASKFAIEGLVDTLRMELSNTGVQCCLIQPGPIESKFRQNAHQAFLDNVDGENSEYSEQYKVMSARLKSPETARFTLPASAVADCVLCALKAKRAKIRYEVTFPTKLFSVLKRLLSDRILDGLLNKAGGGGKR